MTHLPFIAGAYGLTLGVVLFLGVGAGLRLARARRRLDALGGRRSAGS